MQIDLITKFSIHSKMLPSDKVMLDFRVLFIFRNGFHLDPLNGPKVREWFEKARGSGT